jgi:hypothetical protein
MGVCKESFGLYFWGTLHITCLGTKYVSNIVNFINTFKNIIPCGECRKDFIKLIDDHPIPETDSQDIFEWTVDMHNIVNERIGKPVIDYKTALDTWSAGCEGKNLCLKVLESKYSTQMKDPLPKEQDFS